MSRLDSSHRKIKEEVAELPSSSEEAGGCRAAALPGGHGGGCRYTGRKTGKKRRTAREKEEGRGGLRGVWE
jgi:hypothetical protein